jgi:hypothetical protein
VYLLLALAGCGRIGFGAVGSGSDGGVPGDAAVDASPVPPGAKIWLQMETDPTTGIVDSAGGHTCFCDSATHCPTRVAGKHGSGYQFATQAVEVLDAADLDVTNGFTAAAWVRLDSYPPSLIATLFAKPWSSTEDTFVMAVSPNQLSTFDMDDGMGAAWLFSGPTVPLAEWHHMAWVGNGSQTYGYLDGVQVGFEQAVGGFDTNMPFFVGADDLPASFFLDGTLDDVLFYTRPLDQAEITQLATP